jgi:hypothetical protein
MTVIAWDGKTLASDKAAVDSGTIRTLTKIKRAPGGELLAAAGISHITERLFVWYAAGADPEKYPDPEAKCSFLVIKADGAKLLFDGGPFPDVYEDGFIAIGSGRAFAIGAMAMGADARRAVEIASHWAEGCGRGVDAMTLEGEP